MNDLHCCRICSDIHKFNLLCASLRLQMNLFSGLKILRSPGTIPRDLLHRSLMLAVFSVAFLVARVRIMQSGPDIFKKYEHYHCVHKCCSSLS